MLRRRRTGGPSSRPTTTPTWTAATCARRRSLFGILENQVVPRFYDRGRDGVPRQWVDDGAQGVGVARARGHGGPHGARLHDGAVRAGRRVVDPPGVRRRRAGGRAGGVARARRRRRGTACRSRPSTLDDERAAGRRVAATVTVHVDLGGLDGDDVVVQCVHGRVGHDGEFDATEVVPLTPTGVRDVRRRRSRSPPPAPTACRRA